MVHESIVPEVHGLTFNVLKLLMEAVCLKEIDLTMYFFSRCLNSQYTLHYQ